MYRISLNTLPRFRKLQGYYSDHRPAAEQIQLTFALWFQKCVLLITTHLFISFLHHYICTLHQNTDNNLDVLKLAKNSNWRRHGNPFKIHWSYVHFVVHYKHIQVLHRYAGIPCSNESPRKQSVSGFGSPANLGPPLSWKYKSLTGLGTMTMLSKLNRICFDTSVL